MAVIRFLTAMVLGVVFLPTLSGAQDTADQTIEPAASPESETTETPPPAPPAAYTIPKLTVVALEIQVDLSSNGSKSLETFPIRLAKPIELDGVTLVEAGVTGMGEVVHAKKAGGSGAPGELVLAARHLEVDGRHMPLRSLRYAESGESKIKDVNTLAAVAAGTVPAVAFVGFLMKGGEITVGQGTIVEAKLAQDFEVVAVPEVVSKPIGEEGEEDVQLSEESEEHEIE